MKISGTLAGVCYDYVHMKPKRVCRSVSVAFSQSQLRILKARVTEASGFSQSQGLKALKKIGIVTASGKIAKPFREGPARPIPKRKSRKAP